jgi:YfiH family protein
MAQILFTSRKGGTSDEPFDSLNLGSHVGDNSERVATNRNLLRAMLSRKAPIFMEQVHGNDVVEVTSETNLPITADALITREQGLPLVVLTADCLPILISSSAVVGAVHAGRKGLLNGVIGKAVTAMQALGGGDLVARIGPAICSECYEVDHQMYDDAIKIVPELATSPAKHCLDLLSGAKSQLQSYGIKVSSVDICTSHDLNFFSYRRNSKTGRSAGVIVL